MLAASIDGGDPQAERLERMKFEFLVAQQRRRERALEAASRSDDTDDGPLHSGLPTERRHPLAQTVPAGIREARR
jgi:hypothetical protein